MNTLRAFRKYTWAIKIFSINQFLGLIFCFLVSPRLVGEGVTLLDPDVCRAAGRALYESGRYDLIERAPLSYVGLKAYTSQDLEQLYAVPRTNQQTRYPKIKHSCARSLRR